MNKNEEYAASNEQIKGQMTIFDILNNTSSIPKAHYDMPAPAAIAPVATQPATPKKASADFGEHIGGARKELWSSRGLDIGDLFSMNDAERAKMVKKDNIWKKPDYDAMLRDGWDPVVVYARKKVRDGLCQNISYSIFDTEETKEKKQEGYIEFCHALMGLTERFKDRESLFSESKSFLFDEGYVVKERYSFQATEKTHGFLDTKLFRTINISEYTLKSYEREMAKKQFGVKKEDKVPAGYEIRQNRKEQYSSNMNTIPGTYFVYKGYRILVDNIPTREKALEIAKEIAKKKQKAKKKAFCPPQLAHINRTGLPDVRNGRNVEGEDFLKDFAIRGGEFGEWMSEKDAQASLNMAYEAFYDFARALDITPDKVSFGGKLAIAFGARGHGKALAHYEPDREVINLTKMRGAGSLGHELFHALDDIIGKRCGVGGMMTENLRSKNCPESVKKVIDTMLYRKVTDEEAIEAAKKSKEKADKSLDRYVKYYVLDRINDEEGKEKMNTLLQDIKAGFKGESVLEAAYMAVDRLSALKKELTGKIIRKEDRQDLAASFVSYQSAIFADYSERKERTEFYTNSKAMDEVTSKDAHGYWSSTCEMFARAGACYLNDALSAMGGKSDYLTGHSESCIGIDCDKNGDITYIYAMPRGDERAAINAAFDEMLSDLKAKNLL